MTEDKLRDISLQDLQAKADELTAAVVDALGDRRRQLLLFGAALALAFLAGRLLGSSGREK